MVEQRDTRLPRRGGTRVFGRLRDAVVLGLTRIGARYFAMGDTKVFQSIRFDFRTPIAADRSVIAFIRHHEQQNVSIGISNESQVGADH